MNLKTVFNTLIDSIESNHTLKSIGNGLYETELIHPSVSLGDGDTRAELKEEITRANLNEAVGRKALKMSKLDLSEIYRDRQNRANKIFYLSLIAIGASIGLIIIGAIITFIEKSQVNLGIITSISGMLPGLIGGAVYPFYKGEKNDLKLVEKDILKMARLESFLDITQNIADEKQKNNIYDTIIKYMDRSKHSVKKILILAANPPDTTWLHLDKEVREIEEGLKRAKHRDKFQINAKLAVRYRDLRIALLEYEPQIVHFSGHGQKEGLMLEGELGIAAPIPTKALSELFKLCSGYVECVLLNACYSTVQANAINRHINWVIGMPGKIGDRAAIEFAVGFYDALGAGKSVEEAYKFGCNSILQVFPDLPERLIPALKKRKG